MHCLTLHNVHSKQVLATCPLSLDLPSFSVCFGDANMFVRQMRLSLREEGAVLELCRVYSVSGQTMH